MAAHSPKVDQLPVISDISQELRQFGVADNIPAETVGASIVRVRAYERWVKRGRPITDGKEDWKEAEKELSE